MPKQTKNLRLINLEFCFFLSNILCILRNSLTRKYIHLSVLFSCEPEIDFGCQPLFTYIPDNSYMKRDNNMFQQSKFAFSVPYTKTQMKCSVVRQAILLPFYFEMVHSQMVHIKQSSNVIVVNSIFSLNSVRLRMKQEADRTKKNTQSHSIYTTV